MLQTHCHIDHILGNASLVECFNIPIVAHSLEQFNVERASAASLMWGIDYRPTPEIDFSLDALNPIELGTVRLDVRFTPGHAQGHVVFIHHETKQIIAGDVLFMGSVGRVDLPGCNPSDLVHSIQSQLYSLPDDYIVHCGHGPSTTIGREKKSNAFVRENWSALD
ncbi:MAG: MBL fold metallo-hydrolase [Flavobacteriales bacterium]